MSFALALAKRPKTEIETHVGKAADILGLKPVPRPLSATALRRPAPARRDGTRDRARPPRCSCSTSRCPNLDAKLRVQMRTEIKELHQRPQDHSIYVTHDQIEAMTMADRIVVMREGLVEQQGDPLSLYDKPVQHVRRRFIGSPGDEHDPGTARVERRLATRRVRRRRDAAAAARRGRRDGQPVLYGIRPEHCAVGAAAACRSDIVVVEPTGADTQLYCRFNGQEVTAMVRDRVAVRAGRAHRASARTSRAHTYSMRKAACASPRDSTNEGGEAT
jgi:multiple sugar transport system ATP-binding protein